VQIAYTFPCQDTSGAERELKLIIDDEADPGMRLLQFTHRSPSVILDRADATRLADLLAADHT
jgi:hypothetical protein